MTRKDLLCLSLLAVWAAGCATTNSSMTSAYPPVHQGGRGQGFRTHVHYYVPYACSREETGLCQPGIVTGTIKELRLEKNKYESQPGLTAEIQAPGQDPVHVHLAPAWFLARQHINLAVHDKVSLTGVFHDLEGQEGLVASELTWQGRTIPLRDNRGRPLWESGQFQAGRPAAT